MVAVILIIGCGSQGQPESWNLRSRATKQTPQEDVGKVWDV